MIKGIIFDFNRTLFDPGTQNLVNGAKEVIENLSKKVKLCLVSKGDKDVIDILHSYDLKKSFERIILVDPEKEKEKKDFYECLEVMEIKTEECMIVGDKVTGEITIGNLMGMKTIWFRFGKYSNIFPKSKIEEPDNEISNLKELYKHISSNKVQAIVDDLFFSVKIDETAKSLGIDVNFSNSILDADLFIIDLNIESIDPIETIRKIKKNKASKVVGFLSHTQHELKEKAELAGCDIVIPRSIFSEQLPKILKRN